MLTDDVPVSAWRSQRDDRVKGIVVTRRGSMSPLTLRQRAGRCSLLLRLILVHRFENVGHVVQITNEIFATNENIAIQSGDDRPEPTNEQGRQRLEGNGSDSPFAAHLQRLERRRRR